MRQSWLLVGAPRSPHPPTTLQNRPGPPIPPGSSYVRESVRGVWTTLQDMWRLRVAMWFVILWMVYSDAAFLIGSIGALPAAGG